MPLPSLETKNPREAAYLALLASLRQEKFIPDTLEAWRNATSPATLDYAFAQQIAFGSSQMALALDFIAECLSDKKKLSLKLKERALLRTALYQHYFMDRVPLYAIADETVKIARRHCHSIFVRYLNATLRKLSEVHPALPTGESAHALSIRYSYPLFFVQELIKDYGASVAEEIFALQNMPAVTMVRIRSDGTQDALQNNLHAVMTEPYSVSTLSDPALIPSIAASPCYYIQNATPAALIGNLCRDSVPSLPQRILDLCASPGGKLLAVHDFFPDAALYANDISEEKMQRLGANCDKYGLSVSLSCGPGELLDVAERFDVIILDVPCSNSGVLNKRPEARWRLASSTLQQLEQQQLQLIAHARTLLAPKGVLWYMTCSILKRENEEVVEKACRQLNLSVRVRQTILPNRDGWDGGFACALEAVAHH